MEKAIKSDWEKDRFGNLSKGLYLIRTLHNGYFEVLYRGKPIVDKEGYENSFPYIEGALHFVSKHDSENEDKEAIKSLIKNHTESGRAFQFMEVCSREIWFALTTKGSKMPEDPDERQELFDLLEGHIEDIKMIIHIEKMKI